LKASIKLDKIDIAIIRLLNEDGRISNAELARRLGDVSVRTISNRVENLIEREIISIKAIVNPAALGYTILADVLIEVEPGRVREVADIVSQFPQVSYAACATGDCDVSISLRVRSNEELFDFVTEKIGKIPGVQRSHTHLLPAKLKDIDTWLPADIFGGAENNQGAAPK
jgi:Lrp/AsnC family transcriptional regulator for asnA, asnC and gidA